MPSNIRQSPFPPFQPTPHRGPVISAFLLTAILLTIVQLVVVRPLLLAERFLPGAGWVEIAVLAAYAAWLAHALQRPGRWARLRVRVWLLFSVVFFGQLLLGLLGVEECLMTGELHLPVPALVVAGPLYRGEGLFMPILLISTLLLVGPAWCSWLCYIGAWDNALARRARPGPMPSPRRRELIRGTLLAVSIVLALGLRALSVPTPVAVWLAATFQLVGVGVMAWISRRQGWMAHCTAFCPLGWLVVRLGRLSPFRLRVGSHCVACATCRPACRYGALDREAWRRQKVHDSCTLCGDCLTTCGALELRYGRLGDAASRRLLIALVAAVHAVFLGVARI